MDGACLSVVIMPGVGAAEVQCMADAFQRVCHALYTPLLAFNTRVALAQNVRMLAAVLIPALTHQTEGGPPAATPNLASYLHEHTTRQTSEHLSLLGTILFVAQ